MFSNRQGLNEYGPTVQELTNVASFPCPWLCLLWYSHLCLGSITSQSKLKWSRTIKNLAEMSVTNNSLYCYPNLDSLYIAASSLTDRLLIIYLSTSWLQNWSHWKLEMKKHLEKAKNLIIVSVLVWSCMYGCIRYVPICIVLCNLFPHTIIMLHNDAYWVQMLLTGISCMLHMWKNHVIESQVFYLEFVEFLLWGQMGWSKNSNECLKAACLYV